MCIVAGGGRQPRSIGVGCKLHIYAQSHRVVYIIAACAGWQQADTPPPNTSPTKQQPPQHSCWWDLLIFILGRWLRIGRSLVCVCVCMLGAPPAFVGVEYAIYTFS